jgi:hypothetical protein
MSTQEIKPGQRIRVVQEVERREGNWTHETVGTVLSVNAEPTGSWHARGRNDKVWLTRIRLQKADGEITTLVSDQHTRLEVLTDAPGA